MVAEQVTMLSQTPSAFYALQAVDELEPELGRFGVEVADGGFVFGGTLEAPRRSRLGGSAIRIRRG